MRGRLFICGEKLAFFPIFGGGKAISFTDSSEFNKRSSACSMRISHRYFFREICVSFLKIEHR